MIEAGIVETPRKGEELIDIRMAKITELAAVLNIPVDRIKYLTLCEYCNGEGHVDVRRSVGQVAICASEVDIETVEDDLSGSEPEREVCDACDGTCFAFGDRFNSIRQWVKLSEYFRANFRDTDELDYVETLEQIVIEPKPKKETRQESLVHEVRRLKNTKVVPKPRSDRDPRNLYIAR